MNIGVIGNGHLGPALAGVLASGFAPTARVVGWAPVREGNAVPSWVTDSGAPQVADWHELLARVDSVVVDMTHLPNWHDREVVSEAAAEAGRHILVDAPMADMTAVYDRILAARRRGGGRLWAPRPLRSAMAVETAVARVGEGGIGTVFALFGSLHLPVGEHDASFGQHTVDLLDAALGLCGGVPERVFALGSEAPIESTHILAHFPDGAIATLEVARCLPESLGQGRDAVFEVTGSERFLRLAPDAIDITVAGASQRRAAWRENALVQACEAWLCGADEGERRAEADRALITAMRMTKRSRAKGEVMGIDA